jgi:phosphoesterase RecJ-like protein
LILLLLLISKFTAWSTLLDNQALFQGKNIINIDRHLTNGFYGTVNYVNKTSSSTAELVFKTLQNLSCEIDKDMATNLYVGISSATNNFTSYSVNAETFETIAQLLKLGAVKKNPQSLLLSLHVSNRLFQLSTYV